MRRMLHPLFAMLVSLTHQEMARQLAYLKTENAILRARLPKRIHTTPTEPPATAQSGTQDRAEAARADVDRRL